MTDLGPGLLAAIRHVLADAPSSPEIQEDIEDMLLVTEIMAPAQPLVPDPASLSALAHLPPVSEGALGEICALTREAARLMPWHYSYGVRDGLAERIAFADLVGPTGPYVSDRLRLGLTLVGPETLYPMHAHKARELYFVVSGEATWQAGEIACRPKPGSFVLHVPDIPHSMRTETAPLLAIYIWRGDIFSPPYYSDH